MPIDPDNDPNEAYDLLPAAPRMRMPDGWLMATCNGIPVYHFGPTAHDAGRRYISDPAYRLSRERKYLHDRV